MMNQISMTQAAAAMGVDIPALMEMLTQCRICADRGQLSMDQVRRLIHHLEEQQENGKRRAQENLEQVVGRYTVLIDTCSLLHPQFPELMGRLVPLLRQNGKALIVPSGVVSELRRLMVKKPELREQIRALIGQLAGLSKEGLVKVYGGGETFGDQQLIEVAIHYMTTSELLVITQDKSLSMDLIDRRRMRSVQGKSLAVSRINRYGYLSRFQTQEHRFSGSNSRQQWGSVSGEGVQIRDNQTAIQVDCLPETGELVRGGSGRVWTLGKQLASGGEGTIYDLGDGTVAKMYRPGKLTVGRKEKLELMVRNPVNCPGVCWPKELLYNQQNQLVGYRMDRASGVELQRCVFTRPALERYFPHWKKQNTVQLCVTILEKICALHDQGIILGDINPQNILVVSPEEVWFVDCDSYQVGNYPCPVGTVRFTAPEIQKKPFSTFLRTQGHENFAVATLLFMIMLPGKSPYAQQGGEDLSEVIRAMDFPYPCGENRSDRTPEGAWRFMWSHLPRYIKEYFYGTFQRGGAYSEERTRLSAEKWLSAFRYYHRLLADGKMTDPTSAEIFPNHWKTVNPEERAVWQRVICTECCSEFEVTVGERDYYQSHGMVLPRRCPTCRKVRKLERAGFSFSAEF